MDAQPLSADLATLREANRLHLAEIDAIMGALGEASAAQRAPVRCRAGCSTCCRFWVEASPLEAMEIADELRRRHLDTSGMRYWLERAGRTMARSDPDRYWRLQRPCPLLHDGRCAVYEVRPAVCRLHQSIDPPERCADVTSRRIDVDGLMTDNAEFARAAAAHPALAGWPALGPMPALVHRALTG